MDKNQAQKQIRDIFQHPFHRANYQHFLRNLLNQIESRDAHYTGNLIPDSFKEHVTQYWRVGKYIDPDGIELDLLVVEVKSLSKLDRARSALRNFAVNRLKQFGKDCSLVAFYAKDDGGDDWRFSFVKIEHEAHQDDKGKVRLKTELTPAKRYSYLVGVHENSHTACQQLMPLLVMDYANPRIEEIEKAFSIEKVTDEFFEQYKGLYLKLSEQLKSQSFFQKKTEEENTQTVARFAKKLLGQIVFLYFLQKKGWLGVAEDGKWGDGSRRFMRDRFTQVSADEGNYYHDFLQYLFYEALAKERKDQTDPDYYERFSCKIPFLNGGLFEAEYDDWHNLDIDLPNSLFHNDEKNKAGDVGTGILDVFDRYNFTIKEDEPLEKEVAVDPEMLGKVFENMLEITERKSKGAFYTPREIVHYMCQESLLHYLDNSLNSYAKLYQTIDSDQPILFGGLTDKKGQQKLEITHQDGIKVPKEDLETLIRKGHLFVENDEAALQALQRIESGEQKTTKHKIELPESIKNNAEKIDNYLASIRACDPAIGSGAFPVGLLHEIVNARLALAPHSGNSLSVYELKRHTIRKSLYGVDIDASAVDIARLRLWLSLIVDEDDYTPNKSLPNLDYKIVRGNSLIGFPEDWRSLASETIDDLKREFHDTTDQKHKNELKVLIETEIQSRMANSKQAFGYQIDFDFKLFFSEVWHEKDGFDVVIGNPPYVSAWEMTKNDPNQRREIEKAFPQNKNVLKGHWDIFVPFVLRGHLLNSNSGCLTFILPNPVLREKYAGHLRKYILSDMNLKSILHFDESNVFNKVSRKTAVLMISMFGKDNDVYIYRNSTWGTHVNKIYLDQIISKKLFEKDSECRFLIDIDSDKIDLLSVIENRSIPLGSYFYVNYGAQVSSKESGKFKKKDVVTNKPSGNSKKFIEGKDVARWSMSYRGLWLDYRKDELYGARSENLFTNPKIIFRKISDKFGRLAACIDYDGYYTDDGCVIALPYESVPDSHQSFDGISRKTGLSIEYAFAILINPVVDYYFKNKFATESLQGSTSHTYPKTVRSLPVVISEMYRIPIEILTKYVLTLNSEFGSNLIKSFIIELLDSLVFELYFTDKIKAANKEIFNNLGALKPITVDMSDEEKLAVIQSEFDRLYDPKHPVRNNLETLDSVEEVRIIREALKK